ncbi:hypothetical protein QBC34DRAFT_461534 [Podospora aff. communis PSN243]|uniref:Uncharacterized protein n=1 Tax=Podospora aff. communis PSN243 TaxID=3040156 RepID=A0AAV9GRW8_9PEZI|nr:hypothetical protein QBC34DRAFT_461534 [Podospora aff. communis PSN243]
MADSHINRVFVEPLRNILGQIMPAPPDNTNDPGEEDATDKSNPDSSTPMPPKQKKARSRHQDEQFDQKVALLRQRDDQLKEIEALLRQRDDQLERQEQTIRALHQERELLRHRESALRTIILDKAGIQKISDQEMVSRFARLCQRIQVIARLPAYRMDYVPESHELSDDCLQHEFFDDEVWGRLNPKERTNRVRAKMFAIIHSGILDYPLFGVEGLLMPASEKAELRHSGRSLDSGLRRVENALLNQRVPGSLIDDWRILTIECVEKMKPQGYVSLTAGVVVGEIFDFFIPLLSKSLDLNEEEDLRSKLAELCNEAVELRMIMRRSKDRYTCEIPGTAGWSHLASSCEDLVETLAVEGGRASQASDEIAYTLFGGLLKQPEFGEGGKMVLEKAMVILKKQQE